MRFEVQPPAGITVLAGVRADHHVRVVVADVVQRDIAALATLSPARREKQDGEGADASEAAAGEAHEGAMDAPEDAERRAKPGRLASARLADRSEHFETAEL